MVSGSDAAEGWVDEREGAGWREDGLGAAIMAAGVREAWTCVGAATGVGGRYSHRR